VTGSLAGTSPLPEPTDPTGPNGAHSYDPGIAANGVFWTVSLPVDSVNVHLGAGSALLDAENIPIHDVFTVANSFSHVVPLVPSIIDSLRIHWSGITNTIDFSDPVDRFAGVFLENSATIEVTATTPPSDTLHGFQFVSDPASTTTSLFAQIGHEQNGAFFPE
jgi:hypothetical protein